MIALPPFATEGSTGAGWTDATQAVNSWRGALIHLFTRVERVVSETLTALAAVEERTPRVPLRGLIGQRYADLDAAIAIGGPFAIEGEGARAALASFRDHEATRSVLCHGLASIWLERNGRWAVRIDLLSFRAGKAEANFRFYTQDEAEALLKEVRRRCHRLEGALMAVCRAIA